MKTINNFSEKKILRINIQLKLYLITDEDDYPKKPTRAKSNWQKMIANHKYLYYKIKYFTLQHNNMSCLQYSPLKVFDKKDTINFSPTQFH